MRVSAIPKVWYFVALLREHNKTEVDPENILQTFISNSKHGNSEKNNTEFEIRFYILDKTGTLVIRANVVKNTQNNTSKINEKSTEVKFDLDLLESLIFNAETFHQANDTGGRNICLKAFAAAFQKFNEAEYSRDAIERIKADRKTLSERYNRIKPVKQSATKPLVTNFSDKKDEKSDNNTETFFSAIAAGDLEKVKQLHKAGCDINKSHPIRNYPIHYTLDCLEHELKQSKLNTKVKNLFFIIDYFLKQHLNPLNLNQRSQTVLERIIISAESALLTNVEIAKNLLNIFELLWRFLDSDTQANLNLQRFYKKYQNCHAICGIQSCHIDTLTENIDSRLSLHYKILQRAVPKGSLDTIHALKSSPFFDRKSVYFEMHALEFFNLAINSLKDRCLQKNNSNAGSSIMDFLNIISIFAIKHYDTDKLKTYCEILARAFLDANLDDRTLIDDILKKLGCKKHLFDETMQSLKPNQSQTSKINQSENPKLSSPEIVSSLEFKEAPRNKKKKSKIVKENNIQPGKKEEKKPTIDKAFKALEKLSKEEPGKLIDHKGLCKQLNKEWLDEKFKNPTPEFKQIIHAIFSKQGLMERVNFMRNVEVNDGNNLLLLFLISQKTDRQLSLLNYIDSRLSTLQKDSKTTELTILTVLLAPQFHTHLNKLNVRTKLSTDILKSELSTRLGGILNLNNQTNILSLLQEELSNLHEILNPRLFLNSQATAKDNKVPEFKLDYAQPKTAEEYEKEINHWKNSESHAQKVLFIQLSGDQFEIHRREKKKFKIAKLNQTKLLEVFGSTQFSEINKLKNKVLLNSLAQLSFIKAPKNLPFHNFQVEFFHPTITQNKNSTLEPQETLKVVSFSEQDFPPLNNKDEAYPNISSPMTSNAPPSLVFKSSPVTQLELSRNPNGIFSSELKSMNFQNNEQNTISKFLIALNQKGFFWDPANTPSNLITLAKEIQSSASPSHFSLMLLRRLVIKNPLSIVYKKLMDIDYLLDFFLVRDTFEQNKTSGPLYKYCPDPFSEERIQSCTMIIRHEIDRQFTEDRYIRFVALMFATALFNAEDELSVEKVFHIIMKCEQLKFDNTIVTKDLRNYFGLEQDELDVFKRHSFTYIQRILASRNLTSNPNPTLGI